MKNKKINYDDQIAALLSYFLKEISPDNIVSDEVLIYAGPSLDMSTRDVAVMAAMQLKLLINEKEMVKDTEPFWSSFKIWLQDKDLILSSELEEFDESGTGISISASKRLGPALDLYMKQNAKMDLYCSQYVGADNYDDLILQKLLNELSKIQEYPDGSEMVSNVNCFYDLRIAVSEYVNKNGVVFPPKESYVDVLPFHYDSEKDKFRKQLERKRK